MKMWGENCRDHEDRDSDRLVHGAGAMSAVSNLIKPELLQRALDLAAIGRSVLPVRPNKKPLLKEWTSLQAARATVDQITDWSAKFISRRGRGLWPRPKNA